LAFFHKTSVREDCFPLWFFVCALIFILSQPLFESKDGKATKTFDALDWLAQLTTHIPNRSEQMVRYYGFYSNKSRGLRKKAGTDDQVPALIDSDISRKDFRRIGRG
jgi:hypothetical protein